MADEQNAAPAGDGEGTGALSLDDAVATLNGPEEQDQQPKVEAEGEADQPEAQAEETGEEPDSPAEEAEPESEGEPEEEIVHGNAKTRLRDGSVVAVADLKKAFAELQEFRRQGITDFPAQKQEIEQAKAQVQSQRQIIEEALPQLQHLAQSAIPPAPDDALWEADPIEAINQQRRYDQAVARLNQVQATHKALVAEQEKAAKLEADRVKTEHETRLVEARPDLKDPDKRKAFEDAFLKAATAMGFSDDEVKPVYDHRLKAGIVSLVEKAAKWDALQASKPKVVEKTREAPPVKVQQPGRRVAPSERRSAEVDEMSKRLSKTGSLDDAAALLDKLGI
jgi:hypothetical protein